MNDLTFVTGNSSKFSIASHAFVQVGIQLLQETLDIDEVQSEDSEYITRKKCQAAYELLRKPVIVNDDSWAMPGLRGFPGPYAKSMNHWFMAEDWARLTVPLTDRRVILTQIIAFQDREGQHLHKNIAEGKLLSKPRGQSDVSFQTVITMEGDDGLSIAEVLSNNPNHYNEHQVARLWHDVATWYKGRL